MSFQGEISESIKVFIRERPTIADESNPSTTDIEASGVKNVSPDKKSCVYYSSANKIQQNFSVDRYFDPLSEQRELFESIALPIVKSALEGYSGTILAYGPTASGKTHTMRGLSNDSRGIMPRCIEYLLNQQDASHCELWASYLQIYCETITDLLWQPSYAAKEAIVGSEGTTGLAYGANQPLLLREKAAPKKEGPAEVYVEGLSRYPIRSVEDLDELLNRGDLNRSTAATNMNETSSRSHAVLIVKVITPDVNTSVNNAQSQKEGAHTGADGAGVSHRESTLMLVDLAGSERASATAGRGNTRSEEARAINLSLSALGNCMSALASASANAGGVVHVPYRDSKLTRLLQGCLGGGARTAVVVTLAPGIDVAGESLSALRFAARASKVKVSATVNRVKDYEALYREAKSKLKEFQSTTVVNMDTNSALQQKEAQIRQKDNTIEQQALEIAMLKEQLKVLQNQPTSNNANQSSIPISSSSHQVRELSTEELNSSVESALAAANKQHAASLESAHRMYNSKLLIAQQAEQAALRELSMRVEDLKQERERSLSTMRQLREAYDKNEEEESAHKSRTAEFLDEITALREVNEDLTARNEFLDEKVRSLLEEMAESVSKEQVQEMENLFLETVSRLSERVNMLEGGTGGGGSGRGSSAGEGSGGGGGGGVGGGREVRMEPGGRIRAGQSGGAGKHNVPTASFLRGGAANNNHTSSAQNMQHSRSSGAVARRPSLDKAPPPAAGGAGMGRGGLW